MFSLGKALVDFPIDFPLTLQFESIRDHFYSEKILIGGIRGERKVWKVFLSSFIKFFIKRS